MTLLLAPRPSSAWRSAALALLAAALLGGLSEGHAQPTAPASAAAPPATSAWRGPAHCRVHALAVAPQLLTLRWHGGCNPRTRLAEGRGVLRAYQGARLAHSFFGQMVAGRPGLGALTVTGGYQAGRFDAQGELPPDGDRNSLIQAFGEASAAARSLAAHYQNTGQTASARHYRAVAAQLAQQMD